MNSYKFATILIAGLVAASPAAAVKHYIITDLGLVPGTTSSVARAISDNGKIAGEAGGAGSGSGVRFDGGITVLPSLSGADNFVTRGINNAGTVAATIQSAGDDRAALVTTGSAAQLGGVAGYAAAGALDVNNSGVAVGYVQASGRNGNIEGSLPLLQNAVVAQNAVVWNSGVATLLTGPAGAQNSIAVAVNNAGDVAGMYYNSTGPARSQAVVWVGGTASTLVLPTGQVQARVRAISETGWVAGQTSGSLGLFGTVWSPSTSYLLPLFGVGSSEIGTTRGINSAATVVGFTQAFDDNGDQISQVHTLWDFNGSDFTGYDLSALIDNFTGWDFSNGAPQAINDNGDIVGFATAADGFQHGYLLSAVPEPASWALMIGGFGLIGGALRRRRAVIA